MAHFYGTLQGARGQATRTGTRGSGLLVTAAGWTGAIQVYLDIDDQGRDRFRIEQIQWKSEGVREFIADGLLGIPTDGD